MAAVKTKSPTEKEHLIAEICRYDRLGYTQVEIAQKVGLAQSNVSRYLKESRELYKQQAKIDREEHAGAMLARINDIRREAILAWEKSKLDAESIVEEQTTEMPCKKCEGSGLDPLKNHSKAKCTWCKGSGKYKPPGKITHTREGRIPANEYLKTMLECDKMEANIKGLWAPKDININSTQHVINWNAILSEVENAPRTVQVEENGNEAVPSLPSAESAACQTQNETTE